MVVQRVVAATDKKKPRRARGFAHNGTEAASDCLDLDRLAIARPLDGIADLAVDEREKRVVAADSDVGTGVKLRAALANDDRSRRHGLTSEDLDAEHLRLRIAAVTRRAAALLLCHE